MIFPGLEKRRACCLLPLFTSLLELAAVSCVGSVSNGMLCSHDFVLDHAVCNPGTGEAHSHYIKLCLEIQRDALDALYFDCKDDNDAHFKYFIGSLLSALAGYIVYLLM